ncbi:hypothetical protein SAMN04487970_101698 [Paenibacillus tianmuensis]|uniref:XRE family transcriptional regulator n=1 Tax=Paenibacillus tianmuensis TaxID=624147 RepID=A0A1G4RKV4_9BACL|nr:hypothetical protein [Paenibacillus tianmuensis]SCW57426.1 hypothetical protein SAMN04487970_101698 [Paenibacillus tianmuensis]
MNDTELRKALFGLKERYGTPIVFIANKVAVSREHLSKWLHNDSHVISDQLKNRLKQFVKERS